MILYTGCSRLRRVLGRRFEFYSLKRRVDAKTEFITKATTGVLRYHSLSQQDVEVRQYGDTTIVTGQGIVHVESARGDNKYPIRFIDGYVKRDNTWRMVAWQCKKLLESNHPSALIKNRHPR